MRRALLLVGLGVVIACAKAIEDIPPEDAGDPGCPQFNLLTDPLHCGSCANKCMSGEVCSNGQCKAMCDSPLTKCTADGGLSCIDTKADPKHCGSCTKVCTTADGGGIAPGTNNPDAGVAVDASTIGWSTGTAGCQQSTCTIDCPMGMTKCSDSVCYDTQNHHDHCGDCTTQCVPDDEWCYAGHCCPVGQMWCGNACTDIRTDNNNCGGCGNKCTGNTPYCSNGKCVMGCVPTGQRAGFNTIQSFTTTGCWNTGNPCGQDQYNFSQTYGRNFQAANQEIVCGGTNACVGHVGIGTYAGTTVCQGTWDVYCGSTKVGTIDTRNKACTGSAMNNQCNVAFTPAPCSTIKLVAQLGSGQNGCCAGNAPDSMIVAVSAW